ncbi:MAG: polysaccharide deacetylase family protein [Elusimicrobia bacterium]|nr:polysaccharide deacetylase family protein [Elusimicrobiota bacterium]
MSSVPVLLYHHIAPDREVTPEGFAAQLDWLRAAGYRTLSADELHAHLTGKEPVRERAVALTFDDGYADNWIYAYPLLKKRRMLAQLFVVTDRIGRGKPRLRADQGGSLPDTISRERAPEGFLNWAECLAMSADGVFEIGSHTATHRDFDRRKTCADLPGELERSRDAIRERTGAWPGTVAWPWGDYEASWLKRLPELGYRLAFTARPGANASGRGAWRVKRFKVKNGDPKWLARRVALYRSRPLAAAYGALHGLDRAFKRR